jgi:uncharacterized OsmC-like protein
MSARTLAELGREDPAPVRPGRSAPAPPARKPGSVRLMAQPMLVNRVRSYSTGTPGRCLNQARTHHFVIDEPPYRGGAGEEITPAEAFLAGVSACGVLLIEGYAREDGLPLRGVAVEIEATRNAGDPSAFAGVRMRFRLPGASADQAQALVRRYQEH